MQQPGSIHTSVVDKHRPDIQSSKSAPIVKVAQEQPVFRYSYPLLRRGETPPPA